MDDLLKARITNLPEYKTLLKKRVKLGMPLIAIMLVSYFGFILLLAYVPSFLSIRVGDGVTTLGICLGLALIILTFAITGFFIYQTDEKIGKLLDIIRAKTLGA